MSKQRQNYMHRTDVVFSKIVRDRDGRCMAAGTDLTECRGNLQCAHIHSRGYTSIRSNLDNAIALCAAHHVFYTHRPLEWEEWVRHNYGDARWEDLKVLALRYDRVDWKHRYLTLKELADSLGVS